MASLALMYRLSTSDSAADDITALMMTLASMNIDRLKSFPSLFPKQ